MRPLVVAIAQPGFEGLIKVLEGFSFKPWQELSSYGLEEALDFATPLGLIRFGVDQSDTQRSGDLLEMC